MRSHTILVEFMMPHERHKIEKGIINILEHGKHGEVTGGGTGLVPPYGCDIGIEITNPSILENIKSYLNNTLSNEKPLKYKIAGMDNQQQNFEPLKQIFKKYLEFSEKQINKSKQADFSSIVHLLPQLAATTALGATLGGTATVFKRIGQNFINNNKIIKMQEHPIISHKVDDIYSAMSDYGDILKGVKHTKTRTVFNHKESDKHLPLSFWGLEKKTNPGQLLSGEDIESEVKRFQDKHGKTIDNLTPFEKQHVTNIRKLEDKTPGANLSYAPKEDIARRREVESHLFSHEASQLKFKNPSEIKQSVNEKIFAPIREQINKKLRLSQNIKESSMTKEAFIVKKNNGYHVMSEKGKHLGGPYSHEHAIKRLQQIEYFKQKKGSLIESERDLMIQIAKDNFLKDLKI